MRRRVARALVVLGCCGALLSACGAQSELSAMKSWVKNSAYVANNATLISDAKHSATVLDNIRLPASELHTVCAVMFTESLQANSALPSPDDLANRLLAKAYGNLGAGANVCYAAGASTTKRRRALGYLSKGVGQLAEASARIASDLSD